MSTAEIIAIGSELLTPERSDTNSLWLTARLNEIGIEVMLKTVVGDDEARLEETLRDALKRSDVVITTGGLGPTEDDITRRVSARAVERELVYHPGLEQELRERFRLWGREMPEINKRQAYVIQGAEVLPNPNGSASGMLLVEAGATSESRRQGGVMLVVLPGPPRELQPMFENFVMPRLRDRAGGVVVRRRLLRVSGMGESAVDEIIAPIYSLYKNVQTSVLFSRSEIEVHLAVKSDSTAQADQLVNELIAKLAEALGPALFATEGETLEEVVGQMLAQRKLTVSLAESCTGGLIATRITEVPGSSAYFMEGAVTYSNESKIRVLGVQPGIIEQHGAVSAATAEAMARGIRERSGTDLGLSVTGIAGPGGGSADKPVGTVFIGFSGAEETRSLKLVLPGDRYLVRWRTSQAALDYLRRRLLKNNRMTRAAESEG